MVLGLRRSDIYNEMMRRVILIGGSILFGLLVLFGTQKRAETPSIPLPADAVSVPTFSQSELSIGKAAISVELAITEEERVLGLGNREAIAPDAGMLFVFPQSDFQGIWMKGMQFPLDIVWLEKERIDTERGEVRLRIVDIKENVAPETYPEVFFPKMEASYVLEMNGGAAERNGIAIGSVLTLKKVIILSISSFWGNIHTGLYRVIAPDFSERKVRTLLRLLVGENGSG